jgi:hypothetical protein
MNEITLAIDLNQVLWCLVVAGTLVHLRKNIKGVIDAFTLRLGDPTTKISLSSDGLMLSRQLDAIMGDVDNLKSDARAERIHDNEEPSALAEFEVVVVAYHNVDIDDPTARLAEKQLLAERLAKSAIKTGLTRDELAASLDEAWHLALAVRSYWDPEHDDVERIYRVAAHVKSKHVRYWLAKTLGRVLDEVPLVGQDFTQIEAALDVMAAKQLDSRLRDRIRWTRAVLGLKRAG